MASALADQTAELAALRDQHEAARLTFEIGQLRAASAPLREGWGDIVRPDERYGDPDFGGTKSIWQTSLNDRKDGAFLPVYETEQDLARIRGAARNLVKITSVRTGAIDALTNYVMGPGFAFKAIPPDKAQANVELLAAVQRVIDELLDDADFIGGMDREIHGRSREDGEAAIVIDPNGGRCQLRLLEPDQITQPQNPRPLEDWLDIAEQFVSCWKFGVHTREKRTDQPLGYHVVYDGLGADWEYIPASRMQHIKRNVTRSAKRGVSDFYEVCTDLAREAKLCRNMVTGAALQAAVAWVLKPPEGSTQSRVAALVNPPTDAYTRYTKSTTGGSSTQYVKKYEEGTILGTAPGQEYADLPGHERNAGFQIVGQYVLRHIGTRWNMPEYMISGDASNANYASTLVAESPFVKARQADQQFYKRHFLSLIWKVLRIAFDFGRFAHLDLSPDAQNWYALLAAVDVKCDPPEVATRNALQMAQTQETQVRLGILSRRTAANQAGLDYDAEVKEGAKPEQAAPNPFAQFGQQVAESLLECGGKGGKPGPCPEHAGEWADKHFKGWSDSLSKDERGAIKSYTDTSSAVLNNPLRSGGPMHEIVRQQVAQIDSALAKSVVPEDVTVYRGITTNPGLKVGSVFQDRGFISTSLDRDVALNAAEFESPKGGVVMEIHVPKGSRGAMLNHVSGYGSGESEMLLPRGSQFKVTGMRQDNGKTVFDVQLHRGISESVFEQNQFVSGDKRASRFAWLPDDIEIAPADVAESTNPTVTAALQGALESVETTEEARAVLRQIREAYP